MRLDTIRLIDGKNFNYQFCIVGDDQDTLVSQMQFVYYTINREKTEDTVVSCTCSQDRCEHVRFVIEFLEGRGIGMVRNMLRNDGLDFVLTYEMVEEMFTDFYTYLETTRAEYLMKRFVSDRSQPVAATPEPKEPPSPFSLIDVD